MVVQSCGIFTLPWITVLCNVLTFSSASAMLRRSDSFVVPSRDGTRVLVMRPLIDGRPAKGDMGLGSYRLPDGRRVEIANAFPQSGVYEMSDLTPVWTVGWYVFPENIMGSQDLSCVAVVNPFALSSGGTALRFYRDGKAIKQYSLDELVRHFGRPSFFPSEGTSPVYSKWLNEFFVSNDHVILSTEKRAFTLGYHEVYRFDFASGEMISSRLYAPWGLLAIPPVSCIWLWLARRKRRREVLGESNAGAAV